MIRLDRRQLFATGAFGIGGLLLPGGTAFAQAWLGAKGFTHGVASGEPDTDSVLLWTRYVGDGRDAHVRAEVAEDQGFVRIVGSTTAITGLWRDWTVKATVAGLAPGRRYYYRFVAADKTMSPVGRTKTLPEGSVEQFNLAVFSCSNLPVGVFNAYGHAAARDDIDLTLHLGDYFYEYRRGGYPEDSPRWDLVAPQTELITLTDYRLRYASYRMDPDLRALHAAHPMIASMDDHESANDSWEGGAQNHQPEDEGVWASRKAAAWQAYREWMPIDDLPYKSYEIGGLATLFKTETRLNARSRQPETDALFRQPDVAAALTTFKDKVWNDPGQTMMGGPEENWLAHAMRASVKARTTWQIAGVGTIMGETYMPGEAAGWLAPDAPKRSRDYVTGGIELAKAGLPFNFDNWGGYPAARARMLSAAKSADANLIVLSGDSHNAWAYELGQGAGVEFAGHSVTSPGFESSTKTDPAAVAAGLIKASPELKWCDTSRRGYMRLALTPRAATNEWVFMQTIASRSTAVQRPQVMRVRPGRATLETV